MSLFRKIMRHYVRHGFPNGFRIWCLRRTGAKVGKKVYIGEGLTLGCILGKEKNLKIGDRASIAPNVTLVITSDPNNSRLLKLNKKYKFIEVKGKINIEQDAWIGAGVIILPNITIGKSAVVGAGSVVTKDVEPFTVVSGNPAKPMKKLEE